jgi:hypothetical protein
MRRVHFTYSSFAWRLHGDVDVRWSEGLFVLELHWRDLWLGLKSAEDLSHSPQWGSTVRTLINRPMERFAWTNHIYFQITQPGSSTVTPLYQ